MWFFILNEVLYVFKQLRRCSVTMKVKTWFRKVSNHYYMHPGDKESTNDDYNSYIYSHILLFMFRITWGAKLLGYNHVEERLYNCLNYVYIGLPEYNHPLCIFIVWITCYLCFLCIWMFMIWSNFNWLQTPTFTICPSYFSFMSLLIMSID